MRKSLLGFVLAAALLPVGLAHAGVKEDLQAGKSVEEIITKADNEKADIAVVLNEIITNAPEQTEAALAAACKVAKSALPLCTSDGGVLAGFTSTNIGIALNAFIGNGAAGGGGGSGVKTTPITTSPN
jgi:hypothetical protein